MYTEEDLARAFEMGRKLTRDSFENEDWEDFDNMERELHK